MKPGPKFNPNSRRNHCLYPTWKGMRNRCNNPNGYDFKHYGGRGIKICNRWDEFWNFVNDMGPKPTPSHKLERKNNDLGYFPANCVWATQRDQMRNMRRNRNLVFNGVKLPVSAWAEKLNVTRTMIKDRLRRGWGPDKALSIPKQKSGNHSFEAHQIAWAKRRAK